MSHGTDMTIAELCEALDTSRSAAAPPYYMEVLYSDELSDDDYLIVLRAQTTVAARLEAKLRWNNSVGAEAETYFVYQSDGNIVHGFEPCSVGRDRVMGVLK